MGAGFCSLYQEIQYIEVRLSVLHFFQGKGLMQTFWLLEEMQKGSPPKNRRIVSN